MVGSSKLVSDWTVVIAFAMSVTLILSLLLRPKLGVLAYVLFMPMIAPLMDQVIAIPGSKATIALGGLFHTIILFVGLFVIARSDLRVLRMPAVGILVCLLFIMAISIFNGVDAIRGIKELGRIAAITVVYLIAASSFKDESDIRQFIVVLLLSLVVPFSFGIYQQVAHAGHITDPGYYIPPDQRYHRIMGTFGHPVPYAMFINFPLLLCLAFGLDSKTHIAKRLLFFCVAAPLCLTLFWTYTRSCWFGMIVATVFMGIRKNKTLLMLVPILLLLVLVYVPLKSIRLGEFSTGKLTFSGRIEGHKQMLPMVFERPLLGHGLTSFADFTTQSDHLRLLLETGFLGYAAFLCLLMALYRAVTESYHWGNSPLEKNFFLAYMAYFACVVVVGFSETNAIFQYYVWVPGGIVLAARFYRGREETNAKPVGQTGDETCPAAPGPATR